jgi:protein SCO1/2
MSAKPSKVVIGVFGAALLAAGGAFGGEAHKYHQYQDMGGDEHAQREAMLENRHPAGQAAEIKLTDARLVDQHGKTLSFKNDVIGDKIVMVDFVYTTCTTVCPVLSALFAQLQERLGSRAGGEVALVSVSVDPVRDTPARLKQYSDKFKAGSGWTWLTGQSQVVDEVLKSLGAYTPNFADHPAMVLVGDGRSGKWTRFYGFPDPDQIVAKVNELDSARARRASARRE